MLDFTHSCQQITLKFQTQQASERHGAGGWGGPQDIFLSERRKSEKRDSYRILSPNHASKLKLGRGSTGQQLPRTHGEGQVEY